MMPATVAATNCCDECGERYRSTVALRGGVCLECERHLSGEPTCPDCGEFIADGCDRSCDSEEAR